MSLSRLWAYLAVALPVLGALIAPLQSVDLAYHLRAGGEILDTQAIPSADAWTFTVLGLPWTDQQWGGQLILAAAYRIGSWTGLVVVRAILVGFMFGCLLEIVRRRGIDPRTAAWLTLSAFVVAVPALALRPQLIGMAMFAVVLLLVSLRRSRPRWLWAIPLVTLAWANIHGSFFLAPLVVGLAWVEDLHDHDPGARQSAAVTLASVVAACVTPFGPAVWAYAVGLTTNASVTSRITEWQPTSLRDIAGLLFFGSAAAVAILVARRGRAVPWPTLAWLGAFLVIGAYAVRGVAWWSLAAVPVVAGLLPSVAAPTGTSQSPLLRRLNLVVAGSVLVAGIALLPAWRPVEPALGAPAGLIADAPTGVTAALREMERPGDRLLNPQPWGSWFEFALPDLPVAVDSRIELIPAAVWDDYASVVSGAAGWEAILERWQVTLVAVEPDDDGLAARLTDAGWSRRFEDDSGSVFSAP